jgi:hypothetical protein
MNQFSDIFKANQIKTILQDKFKDNRHDWEHTNSEEEYAAIKSDGYHMHNLRDKRWSYYSIQAPLKKDASFLIETEIEFIDKGEFGQAGIIWGWDKKFGYANRFTISSDGHRVNILCFEKDHRRDTYQFLRLMKKDMSGVFKLKVMKSGEYYFFLVNDVLINIANEYHFLPPNAQVGYYVEPYLHIRSPHFIIKEIS